MRPKSATTTAVCLLVAICAAYSAYGIVHARPMLDEATNVRRIYVSPFENSTYEGHFYSTDLPAFSRFLWRPIFAAAGWRWKEFDDAHYIFQTRTPLFPANIRLLDRENPEVSPRGPVYIMRSTAAAFLTAACVIVFFLTLKVTGSRAAALVVPLLILFHPATPQWVIGYPGTDAMLLFWIVLFLALWVRFHLAGTAGNIKQVCIMALVAGLSASTKINAGLLVVAYAPYLLIHGGPGKRIRPAELFCLMAFGIFVAINPVLWQPGAGGVVKGMRDIFARRADVMREQALLRPLARSVYFDARLVFVPVVPWVVAAVWYVRKERWLVPCAYWSAVIFAGSYVMLNRYDLRLGMPMDVAIIVPGAAALLAAGAKLIKSRGSLDGRKDETEG